MRFDGFFKYFTDFFMLTAFASIANKDGFFGKIWLAHRFFW
ncbi:hypothetical protein LV89_03883 [Arcicella aurantiaca]|uniref:Uncharacterized protein n=1 Tax=Arcicella aurantiaca TaxID=591202 RepID=A0A316DU27_9BACT|nr:hypothetical protein LV89_03883 [Arcicella aurantiaca]